MGRKIQRLYDYRDRLTIEFTHQEKEYKIGGRNKDAKTKVFTIGYRLDINAVIVDQTYFVLLPQKSTHSIFFSLLNIRIRSFCYDFFDHSMESYNEFEAAERIYIRNLRNESEVVEVHGLVLGHVYHVVFNESVKIHGKLDCVTYHDMSPPADLLYIIVHKHQLLERADQG